MRLRCGFSFVEVLVAITIFSIVFLGLFATVSFVISNNLRNLERNEAVRILEESLESVRDREFSSITEATLNKGTSSCIDSLNKCQVKRQMRNFSLCFGRFFKIGNLNSDLKKVLVEVCWRNKGKFYKISGETVVRRED